MNLLAKLSDACEKMAIVLAAGILILVFCLVFSGVIFRVLGSNFSLSEELSRWGLISICFIGASAALKQKQHVAVNMLMQVLPLRVGKVCVTVAYLLTLVLLAFSTYYSLKAAIGAEGMAGDIIPISMMYVKLTLPLGMSMMIVHLLHGFFGIARGRDIDSILIGS
ncbi:MAG: TRAP-type C4-dicarboxylate transport system, small permease component [Proteobacteria bacterium]|nr:TRAP-type C4-dicarboxylate transport system, small permease component [Pseudomonadota bacterium]